jgi:hypothetical protein
MKILLIALMLFQQTFDFRSTSMRYPCKIMNPSVDVKYHMFGDTIDDYADWTVKLNCGGGMEGCAFFILVHMWRDNELLDVIHTDQVVNCQGTPYQYTGTIWNCWGASRANYIQVDLVEGSYNSPGNVVASSFVAFMDFGG